jgi:hypothetical protein
VKRQIKFTTHKNQLSILIIVLLAGLTMFGVGQKSSAQIIRTDPQVKPTPPPAQRIIVFKGTGTQQPPPPKFERSEKVRTPAALTTSEKQNLFNEALQLNGVPPIALVMPYAVLTPRTPYFENKAGIKFSNVDFTTAENIVGFRGGNSYTWFVVYVKPIKAGQWFMVDCSLGVEEGRNFTIEGSIAGTTATTKVPKNRHIQIFLEAVSDDWHHIIFQADPGPYWYFYSCEIIKKD